MADQPKTEKEFCLRGDYKIRWVKGTGQWEEPEPEVNPNEIGGTTLKVHRYLGGDKIGPEDSLAPKSNDDNNQVKIKKGRAKPIRFYVNVPGAGDHPHDDYSYHSPPWDSNGSSNSSMCPPYSANPGDTTNAGGWGLPLPSGFDPSGTLATVMGEVAPSAVTGMLSQGAQFGGAPPASPSLSQRFNIFPFRQNLIPMALRTFRKFRGMSDLRVRMWAKSSDAIPGGQSIEMDVTLIPMTDLSAPSQVWRKAFVVDSSWPSGISGDWKQQDITFKGFDQGGEYPITFSLCRRSDVSPNYSGAEIWVMFTILGPLTK